MNPERTATPPPGESASTTRFFTPASANQALVLVRKIVEEIVTGHALLMQLRDERAQRAEAVDSADRADELNRRIERQVERLTGLQEELDDVGCDLKDWRSGLVDFPALYHGRKVLLCWKLGESQVSHWHELDGGFTGRKPLDPNFWTAQ